MDGKVAAKPQRPDSRGSSVEPTIHLGRLYYPVHTLGPGNRVGIWLAGCDKRCTGCISPELQSVHSGTVVEIRGLLNRVRQSCPDLSGYTISGGEPFLYPRELKNLVEEIHKTTDDIIVFTGYTLDQLREKQSEDIDEVLSLISVLIDGPYRDELNDGRGLKGSSNQTVFVFRHADRYGDLEKCERSIQLVVDQSRVMTIGIP